MGADLKDVNLGGDMSSDRLLVLNMMRGKHANEQRWTHMYAALGNEAQSIWNNTSLDGYIVRKYDTTFSPPCENDLGVLAPPTHEWLNDQGINGSGVSIWLIGSECNEFVAIAEGYGAWDEPTVAFISGDAAHNTGHAAVRAVHEGLHPYLRADDCDVIKSSILNGDTGCGNSNDHNLGNLYTGWLGDDASPMLGWYDECEATAGECDGWAWTKDGFSTSTSSCTREALEISADHELGQH